MSPKIIFTWSNALAQAIESYGIASADLFAEAGVAPVARISPFDRVEVARLRVLFDRANVLSGDPAFVLRVVDFISPTTLHALGLALFASPDLLSFFTKVSRFSRLLTDQDGDLRISPGDPCFTLHITSPERDEVPELVHLFVAGLLRFVRMVSRSDYSFHAVSFRDRVAASTQARFRDYFGCAVHFAAADDSILVTRDDMTRPLSGHCADIEALQDSIVMQQISQLASPTLSVQVQSFLLKSVAETPPKIQAVARALALSPRALQARLQEEGTTFQAILDGTRRSLAAQYLAQPDLSVGEIAYRLGYGDTSSFCRAFKRWTGKSPRD